jgi:hypothetical protein
MGASASKYRIRTDVKDEESAKERAHINAQDVYLDAFKNK